MNGTSAPEPAPEARDGSGRVTLERSLLLVLLVLAVSAVVAIAANGMQLLLPASDLGGGGVWGVRVAGAATAALGVAGLLVQRKRLGTGGGRGTDPTGIGLRAAVTIMGAVTLIALFNPPPRSGDDTSREASFSLPEVPLPGEGSRPRNLEPPRSNGRDPIIQGERRSGDGASAPVAPEDQPLLQRVSQALAGIFLIVGIVILLWALSRRSKHRRQKLPADGILLAPEDAEASIKASLGEITGESQDPRSQITYAYRVLLTTLDGAGAPRRTHEAPHEYLYRVLGPLGVRPEPLHRLTSLYVLAQFSGGPVTEQHRSMAADALEVSLAHLRVSRTDGQTAHRSAGSHGADHLPDEVYA